MEVHRHLATDTHCMVAQQLTLVGSSSRLSTSLCLQLPQISTLVCDVIYSLYMMVETSNGNHLEEKSAPISPQP